MLDEKQKSFIDYYLETADVAGSAKRAGFDKNNSLKIGLDLLGQQVIQEAIKIRREELNSAYKGMEFSREDVIRIYWMMLS